jgi:hypothetical protein
LLLQQDALALFFAETVCHMALTALAAIHNVPSTGKLAAPALQRGEANAQQQGQLSGTSTSGNTLIHELQSLLAVFGRGQSSASLSPEGLDLFCCQQQCRCFCQCLLITAQLLLLRRRSLRLELFDFSLVLLMAAV